MEREPRQQEEERDRWECALCGCVLTHRYPHLCSVCEAEEKERERHVG